MKKSQSIKRQRMKRIDQRSGQRIIRQKTIRQKNANQVVQRKMPPQSEIPIYPKDDNIRIALIQPASFGDNINSTLMLQPLKKHFKGCRIDVHTSTKYGNVFLHNPYIDTIIYHKANNKRDALHLGLTVPELLGSSNYNHVLVPHPMFNPGKWSSCWNPEWGENLILAWVRALEKLDVKYDTPLETVLQLSDAEVEKVKTYVKRVPEFAKRRNILLEIEGESGQTPWNPQWTMQVGKHLLDGNTNLFFSHQINRDDIQKLSDLNRGYVHWVGKLTIRECAELFNHCDAFFSVSSGLSNACNTNWCRDDVKWFEVVNSLCCSSAAIRKDGKVFWHEGDPAAFIKMLVKRLPNK